ncbi:MAG: lipopolysaccharide biosynthesis protein [Burkholderiales bacterium]|nr:lipopolysaccharide biosynthesis protein [Burkholderiales bacterium]
MNTREIDSVPQDVNGDDADNGPQVHLVDLLTWLGEGKRFIGTVTLALAVASLAVALLSEPIYTARATLLPPGAQQQSGSAAALAALGSLGGLAGGMGAKTPDELYVALLKSDSVTREMDQKFDLKKRYKIQTNEVLRKTLPSFIRISSDKKSGVINIEVDDKEPKFAADLANAMPAELTKVLSRLAVTEAQQRRVFYEQQLKDTKERLIKAEQDLRGVQEKSGVIVLDKQAEALIGGAAQLRALIAEREVQLKVLRTSATEQNPDVMRLNSELRALRAELARMESKQDGASGSAVDMPVGKIPEAAIDYVRARRELKLQETLLEGMVRQYELAKLDEAKEGTSPQQVDKAIPPDYKSKPSRAMIVIAGILLGLLGSSIVVVWRRYSALARERDPESAAAWQSLRNAWRLRG